jgi:hypothetical protein
MLNSLLHIPKTNTGTNLKGSFATVLLKSLDRDWIRIKKFYRVNDC